VSDNIGMPRGMISGCGQAENVRASPVSSSAHSLIPAFLMAVFCTLPPAVFAASQVPVRGENGPSPIAQAREDVAQASQNAPEFTGKTKVAITVVDENGVAVPGARITVSGEQGVRQAETDYAGRCEWTDLAPATYQVRVEKEGFYAFLSDAVRIGEIDTLEVTLNHVREFVEVVNVVYSPPAIDPVKTSSTENLSSEEVVNLPYTVTRDIRYALPLMPGVLQDALGQVHVNGSSTRQIVDRLDGFNIADPANGLFMLRVSTDALRSVEVLGSRASAEHGKGSGGVLNLGTGMGDDRFRISSTDFVPSLQNRKGIHINTWTPRATVSGPLRKGKAWFLDALDGEYDLSIIEELPEGADRNPAWFLGNLAKAQVNLTPGNNLTTSFLINRFRTEHAGLSPFNPQEATTNEDESVYVFTVKDQAMLGNGMLLEVGLGASRFQSDLQPLGDKPYVIRPESTSGNYFATAAGRASRWQGIANVFLPPWRWHGRHECKIGIDLDRVTTHQFVTRRPYSILREDGTLSREVTFTAVPAFTKSNAEVSGHAQDRWSESDRLLLEAGARVDWDQVLRRPLFSPRLASSLVLTPDRQTKLTWGIGLYYDATSLDLLTRGLTGRRLDLFYDSTGETLVRPPVETSLLVEARGLRAPRFLNWSIDLERKLPKETCFTMRLLRKRGANGWTYINRGAAQGDPFSGRFELVNERRDHYDALELTARRTFKGNNVVFASYTRSAARSTAVLNFSLDSPLFSPQAGGPLPWDSPSRLDSWGWLPLPWKCTLAYWLDWRDGFPFSLVNQDEQLVGSPDSHRYPAYFSLNVHLERRFHVLGFEWALRAGFDNITNHQNPFAVDNNVDSRHFLTFGAIQGRALTGRIRLLGRK
jgi:hypothetical protein